MLPLTLTGGPNKAVAGRALGLNDRIGLLRAGGSALASAERDVDMEIALWKDTLEGDPTLWEAKLASLDLTEGDLRRALALAPPADFARIAAEVPAPTSEDLKDDDFFAGLVAPFLRRFERKALQGFALERRADIAPLLDGFVAHIEDTLRRIAERCAILELNVARLQCETVGATPEARFQNYGLHLGTEGAFQRFFETYPVVARAFRDVVEDGVSNFQQFCARLTADADAISREIFDGCDIGPPSRALFGLGDRHRAGQTVAEVIFRSGASVIYKPRSIDVDLHLREVHAWMNTRIPGLEIWSPRLLAGRDGSYGWMETVSPAPCLAPAERDRFFFRQGAHIAIFHTLGGTDLHRENLIACGEQPVYVDVEALMHPRLLPRPEDRIEACLDAALGPSVLATGLLPAPFGQQQNVDLSGIAGRNGQRTPYKVLQWRDFGTDHWRYERGAATLQPSFHAARDETDEEVPAVAHIDVVQRGFRLANATIRADRVGFADLLERLAHDPVRVVARATSSYGILLQESTHPDIAADCMARDRLFDELWLPTRTAPVFAKLVASEQRDLRRFDIPVFGTTPSSTSLFDADGEELTNAVAERGLDVARRRLAGDGPENPEKQLWLIDATLRLQAWNEGQQVSVRRHAEPLGQLTQDSALAAAVDIGDLLLARGYSDPVQFWLTAERVGAHQWTIARTGLDLYAGLPGIALFFDALATASGEARFRMVAEQSIATLLDEIEMTDMPGIGLYTGLGGVLYTLGSLSKSWGDPALATAAQRLIPRILAGVEADRDFDITDGSAGAIIGLAALLRETPNDGAGLQTLQRCADHLLRHAARQTAGIGWHIRLSAASALSGMAHGSAGMAWALAEAWDLTGHAPYKTAAEHALEHERSLFDPAQENWADLRQDQPVAGKTGDKFMASWCHGAPGIALARIGVQRRLPNTAIPAEIDTACRTTRRHLSDENHSLCHGLLGNLDCLLNVWEWSGQSDADPQMLCTRVQGHAADAWRCGIPVPVQVPGLMLGLSGIGYGLLRLACPQKIGSLLLPQAPTMKAV